MKIHASKQWNLNYQWFIYYIPKSLLFLKKKNAFSYLYTFSKHTTIVPIHLDQILRLRCTDFTWIDNLYFHLKGKNFSILRSQILISITEIFWDLKIDKITFQTDVCIFFKWILCSVRVLFGQDVYNRSLVLLSFE